MNTGIVGADAATAVPARNTPSTTASARAGPHRSAARPVAGSATIAAMADAAKAQPYSRRPPRSATITGMIAITINSWTAVTISRRISPAVSRARSAKTARHGGGWGCDGPEPGPVGGVESGRALTADRVDGARFEAFAGDARGFA